MARARTLATLTFVLFVPFVALAQIGNISLSKYTVAPTTIYPSAMSGGVATSTAITIGFNQRVKASITIEDSSGTSVRALYSSTGVTTPTPKIWDGKDNGGVVVAPGIYTILVSAATTTLMLTDNSQQVTVALPPVLTPPTFTVQSYTFPLLAGWNLFSTPVTLENSNATSVFASTSADAIWSYDPSDVNADPSGWLVYDPAHPDFSNLTNVTPGNGYFVHALAPGSVTFSGSLFVPGLTPPSRALNAGWNLVGSYASSSTSVDSAFATIGWPGLEYTSLWELDAALQTFSLPNSVNPGDAFWILLDAPHIYAPADL